MAMDHYDAAMIGIGGKGSLGDKVVRRMAPAPAMALAQNPSCSIGLMMDGYDDDPRELWQIPECVDFIRRYARASGLHDWRGPLFEALDEASKALLLACDAVDKPHPFVVVPEAAN